MTNLHSFRPEWISPPGNTINDLLEERKLSVEWLAEVLRSSVEIAQDLLIGRHRITDDIAEILSDVLGSTSDFWVSRDQFYLECLEDRKKIIDAIENGIPYNKMVEYGWIERETKRERRLDNVLNFFEVPNVIRWDKEYGHIRSHYAFRTSKSFDSNPVAVAAWIKQGERFSYKTECSPWNPQGLIDRLSEFRDLTRQKDPQIFLPQLKTLSAQFGVAVEVVPPLPGCTASGVSKTNVNGNALIILSGRHLSDDHFWFTFFHELGHLILHHDRSEFIDFSSDSSSLDNSELEFQANEFAQNILIPPEYKREMASLPHTYKDVMRFAAKIGTSHGIVVGQMQYLGLVRHNWLNQAKRRYKWENGHLVRA